MTDTTPVVSSFNFAPRNPRGVCSVCGERAYDHRATKCETHRTPAKGTKVPPKGTDEPIQVNRDPAEPPAPPDLKAARALVLKSSITDDVNPVLVQAFAFLCQPVPTGNFYEVKADKIVPTELGKAAQLSGFSADMLGKGLAELEKAPVTQAATAFVGPMLPVLWGVAAIAVVGFHGYKLMALRDQVLIQYRAATGGDVPADVTPPAERAAQEAAGGTVTDIRPDLAPEPTPAGEAVDAADLPDVAGAV